MGASLTSAWEDDRIVSIKRSVRTPTAIVWTLSQLRMSQTLLKKWVEFCTPHPVACFGSQMFHQKGNDEFPDTYILLFCVVQCRMHKTILASQCEFVFQSHFYRVLLNPPFKLTCPLVTKGTLPKDWWPWIKRTIQFQRRILKPSFVWDTLYKKNLWNCCEVAWRVFPLVRKTQIYWVAKIADQSRDLLGSRKSNCLTTVNGLFFLNVGYVQSIDCRHMFHAGLAFILSRPICALDSNREETDMESGVFGNQIACNFDWIISIRKEVNTTGQHWNIYFDRK